MIDVKGAVVFALVRGNAEEASDDDVIASFRRRADAEFTRRLWEESSQETGLTVTECLIDGSMALFIGDET